MNSGISQMIDRLEERAKTASEDQARILRVRAAHLRMKYCNHKWFQAFRKFAPRVDVFDCACGARRKVYAGMEVEIIIDNPNGAESTANCLYASDDSVATLPDAQGDRLRSHSTGA